MKKNGLLSQIKKIRTLVGSSDQYLSDPAKTQEKVLEQLLAFYKLNEYGRQHGSETIGSYEEYKNAFPAVCGGMMIIAGWVFSSKGTRISYGLYSMAALMITFGILQYVRHSKESPNSSK